MAHLAEQLKDKGNAYFKNGDFEQAANLYGLAIQKNSSNPLLYTNRANARLKLGLWPEALEDCLRSIELLRDNMKAYFFLAQAQLEMNHPNEAYCSAVKAYELCAKQPSQTSSAFTITAFVLKCKRAKWDVRERNRLRQRSQILSDLDGKLEADMDQELAEIEERKARKEIGNVGAEEEASECRKNWDEKRNTLRTVFAIADPANLQKREVPDYLVDDISFEIMHDPVITKHGHSYERATIIEHLKRNPIDPLTRDPLSITDLRPNVALKKACEEFWEQNSGWAYEW